MKVKAKRILDFLGAVSPFLVMLLFYVFNKLVFDGGSTPNIKAVLFGAFLLTLLYAFIVALVRKVSLASTILAILFMVFTTANCIKMYFTNDPILFSDLKYLNDFREIISIADSSFTFSFVTVVLPAILFILLNLALLLVVVKRNTRTLGIGNRILHGVLAVVLALLLLNPPSGLRTFLMKNIYDRKGNGEDRTFSSNIGVYGVFGIASGMYYHYLENRLDPPSSYDGEEMVRKAEASILTQEKSLGKPNIIVYFSESFWNMDRVEDVVFDKETTGNFNRLKEEGLYFEMVSPVFGGITGNVEFEFLTGANLSYFGHGYVPYMQLYTNDHYYSTPAVTHELKANGYETKIILYTGPRLFNCAKFYGYADFDYTEFNYEEPLLGRYLPEEWLKGGRPSEEHIVDEIIREFSSKEEGKKEFYMVLTMQTHSPYRKDKYDTYDLSLVSSPYPESLNEGLLSYAQGIYDTDRQLQRLYEYIQTLEEPTLIVFFGDHLPQISDQYGTSMLDTLTYFNTGDEELDLFRKYNTQALLLANYPLPKEETKVISPDLLSAYLLSRMDLEISPYYRWLSTAPTLLQGMNKYVAVDAEGTIHSIGTLTGPLKEEYDERHRMQFRYFVSDYQ